MYNEAASDMKHLWHVENKNFWKDEKTYDKISKKERNG